MSNSSSENLDFIGTPEPQPMEEPTMGRAVLMCGRCYDEVDAVYTPSCQEKPEFMFGPIGMYHCPDCGAMVLAGIPHPPVCLPCLEGRRIGYDLPLPK